MQSVRAYDGGNNVKPAVSDYAEKGSEIEAAGFIYCSLYSRNHHSGISF